MTSITVSDARAQFSETLRRSRTEAVVVERRGRAEAIIISPIEYERLLSLADDAEDVQAFDDALAEEGANIPWAQAKADLGWE